MKKYLTAACLFLLGVGLTLVIVECGNNASEGYNYFMEEYEYLDDKNHVFTMVSYSGLMDIIDHKGSYVIYLGGSWCPNCQAAVPFINEVAKNEGINTVYSFDTRLDSKTADLDIRKCRIEALAKMWYDLVTALGYTSDERVLSSDGSSPYVYNGNYISNMRVPTVLVIKDGVMVGNLTREYIYDDMEDADKNEYRKELKELFDLL